MNTFLNYICDKVIESNEKDFSKICVVFPSRRAGLYFRNMLGRKFKAPVWSPAVFSIEDFIEYLSGYSFADSFKLLIELYKVYKDVVKTETETDSERVTDSNTFTEAESFDNFYPWGEMLLKDFDIVDKYLVYAGVLFKRIKNLKEIEENFPLELQDTFRKFWGSLFDTDSTLMKENFLKIWKLLEKLYTAYKSCLESKGICYPGMAYRKLQDDLKSGNTVIKWDRIIFAGFNALSNSERNIMRILSEKGIAELYFDGDDYYSSDRNQEAGDFIRKNIKNFGIEEFNFGNDLLKGEKNICSIGTSSAAGMAKVLGSELKEICAEKDFKPENTVVVLPEENLLLPVMYSIPDGIKEVNVTMGLPFSDTPLYNLINLLFDLQSSCIFEKGRYKFHHNNVEKILLHPYIKFVDSTLVYEILNYIKKNNIVYFSPEEYPENVPGLFESVFKKLNFSADTEKYLREIIEFIADRIISDKSGDVDYRKFQLEYIFGFYSNFNRFSDTINEIITEINTETYCKFLLDLLKNVSIPFTGEPLKGLQIMGLLETRNLDFENVFVLSVNEGVLPKGNMHNSFIPYSLRKAMKMPTYEDEDSVTAYYFYRLIQNAKNIYLVYNTEIGNNVKEKSRYLLQIENELIEKNRKIKFTGKIVVPEFTGIEKKAIEIRKDEKILEKLKSLKRFSPSSLIKYITCPLQFYFEKCAGLKEKEKVEETFDSRLVGNVIHEILENLFKPYEESEVDEKEISVIIEKTRNGFDEILYNAVRKCGSKYILTDTGGKNFLFRNIVYQLLIRVLENEKKLVPYKIISLEKEIDDTFGFNSGGKEIKINIYGRMDRVDAKDGVTRIIDYKTGGFELKKFKKDNPTEYFENLISNSDFKENFQAFFYGYFYSGKHKEEKINVGIYPVKKLNEGIHTLMDGYIENELFNIFEDNLKKLFEEIFNPEIPFKQTEDEKRCSYCPYAGFCYRDLKNAI
ncbi:MAG: PD-(D/E)XK nuclease family protein [Ignavibacteriae bacterium]|nr:PD-(D/E)XK nuclease family protein [Ignavibacteriota bacterium]